MEREIGKGRTGVETNRVGSNQQHCLSHVMCTGPAQPLSLPWESHGATTSFASSTTW